MAETKVFENNEPFKPVSQEILEKYFTNRGKYSEQQSEERKEELKRQRESRKLSFFSLDNYVLNYSFGY